MCIVHTYIQCLSVLCVRESDEVNVKSPIHWYLVRQMVVDNFSLDNGRQSFHEPSAAFLVLEVRVVPKIELEPVEAGIALGALL